MKIIDFIVKNEHRQAKERLTQLIEVRAPEIMIERQQQLVEELAEGKIKIGGDQKLLQLEFEKFEVKTGRGGKIYLEFDSKVRYFPQAKYGRFITT